jgi:hypothetical protein
MTRDHSLRERTVGGKMHKWTTRSCSVKVHILPGSVTERAGSSVPVPVESGVDFSGAHVFARLDFVALVNRFKSCDVHRDGRAGLANSDRLRAAIVVDDGYAGVADFAAIGVAKDDQLDNGKHHGHDHENG